MTCMHSWEVWFHSPLWRWKVWLTLTLFGSELQYPWNTIHLCLPQSIGRNLLKILCVNCTRLLWRYDLLWKWGRRCNFRSSFQGVKCDTSWNAIHLHASFLADVQVTGILCVLLLVGMIDLCCVNCNINWNTIHLPASFMADDLTWCASFESVCIARGNDWLMVLVQVTQVCVFLMGMIDSWCA